MSTFRRLLAIFLAHLIFLTNCALLHAVEINFWDQRRTAETPPRDSDAALKDIVQALSNQYGTVQAVTAPDVKPRSQKIVVHIQDVHMNAEAQANISRAITTLLARRHVDVLALEGAFERIDVGAFQTNVHRDALRNTANFLFKNNDIAGPLYAAITGSDNFPSIVGIDDRDHYRANVAVYKEAALSSAVPKARWTDAWQKLKKTKAAHFNARLLAFDRDVESYRERKTTLGDHLVKLSALTAFRPKQVAIFLESLSLESRLNYAAVEKRRAGISAALNMYSRYVSLSKQLDADSLLTATDDMEEHAYAALARTAEEKSLVNQSKNIYLTGKLLDFSLTSREWTAYKSSSDFFLGTAPFARFYAEAEARDRAMSENLLSAMEKSRASVVILVTGGFHAAGMDTELRKHGVTTISYVPRIKAVDSAKGNSYLSVFRQEKTPLEKIFNGPQLFLSPPVWTSAKRVLASLLVASQLIWSGAGRFPHDALAREVSSIDGRSTKADDIEFHVRAGDPYRIDLYYGGVRLQTSLDPTSGEFKRVRQTRLLVAAPAVKPLNSTLAVAEPSLWVGSYFLCILIALATLLPAISWKLKDQFRDEQIIEAWNRLTGGANLERLPPTLREFAGEPMDALMNGISLATRIQKIAHVLDRYPSEFWFWPDDIKASDDFRNLFLALLRGRPEEWRSTALRQPLSSDYRKSAFDKVAIGHAMESGFDFPSAIAVFATELHIVNALSTIACADLGTRFAAAVRHIVVRTGDEKITRTRVSVPYALRVSGLEQGIDGAELIERLRRRGLLSRHASGLLASEAHALVVAADKIQLEFYSANKLASLISLRHQAENTPMPPAHKATLLNAFLAKFLGVKNRAVYFPHGIRKERELRIGRADALFIMMEALLIDERGQSDSLSDFFKKTLKFSGRDLKTKLLNDDFRLADGRSVWFLDGQFVYVSQDLLRAWCREATLQQILPDNRNVVVQLALKSYWEKVYGILLTPAEAFSRLGLMADNKQHERLRSIFGNWLCVGSAGFFFVKEKTLSLLLHRLEQQESPFSLPIATPLSDEEFNFATRITAPSLQGFEGGLLRPIEAKDVMGISSHNEKLWRSRMNRLRDGVIVELWGRPFYVRNRLMDWMKTTEFQQFKTIISKRGSKAAGTFPSWDEETPSLTALMFQGKLSWIKNGTSGFFGSVPLQEIVHILAAKAFGLRVEWSWHALMNSVKINYAQVPPFVEIAVRLSGPMINFAIGWFGLALLGWPQFESSSLFSLRTPAYAFVASNLLLALSDNILSLVFRRGDVWDSLARLLNWHSPGDTFGLNPLIDRFLPVLGFRNQADIDEFSVEDSNDEFVERATQHGFTVRTVRLPAETSERFKHLRLETANESWRIFHFVHDGGRLIAIIPALDDTMRRILQQIEDISRQIVKAEKSIWDSAQASAEYAMLRDRCIELIGQISPMLQIFDLTVYWPDGHNGAVDGTNHVQSRLGQFLLNAELSHIYPAVYRAYTGFSRLVFTPDDDSLTVSTIDIVAKEFDPQISLKIDGSLHFDLPVLPTVYSPSQSPHVFLDASYYRALLSFSELHVLHLKKKRPEAASIGDVKKIAVVGAGSGADFVTVYFSWLHEKGLTFGQAYGRANLQPEFHLREINPFAVAGLRDVVRRLGLVKVTLEEASGLPTSGDYDLVIWNMPEATGKVVAPGMAGMHDHGANGRQALIDVRNKLSSVLSPGGMAILWNSKVFVDDEATPPARMWTHKFLAGGAERPTGLEVSTLADLTFQIDQHDIFIVTRSSSSQSHSHNAIESSREKNRVGSAVQKKLKTWRAVLTAA